MSKIVVCSLGFRGHVNPLLAVVATLTARGHDVAFFGTGQFEEDITRTGATFRRYDSMFEPKVEFPKDDATFSYFLATVLEARKVLPQILVAVRGTTPDLVLYEGACLSGRLLGEILRCPTAKLCPSYASTERYSPFEEGRRTFFEDAQRVAAFEAAVSELNAEFGVDYSLETRGGHAERLNLVCMPRHFHPNEAAFDDRFVFFGPSLRDAPARREPPGEAGRPLLYVSLGTLNNNKPAFYRKCFEAFGASEWDVVMPVGDRVEGAAWKVPANFRVEPFVPQLEVLSRATCFVSQGGMNSVQEALYLGVPLVVLPSTGEQSITADRVAELGLGVRSETEDPALPDLTRMVREVAGDPGIAKRVQDFSLQAREAGGPAKAADALEAAAAGRP